MKAVQLTRHGGPDVLQLREVQDPQPAAGEVLVRVEACAINALDVAVRLGGTETVIPLPLIPGADIAGSVAAVGDGVNGGRVGERVVINPRFYCGNCGPCLKGEQSACLNYRVLGWHRDGGYAEWVAVPASKVRSIGNDLPFAEAAAAPITFTTAWRMLVSRARVQPGEQVLVLGASGGVGTAAVQIARLLGARVAATTSRREKIEPLERLGAELVLQQGSADFDSSVQRWTGGAGVDVVVQTLGGDTWQASLAHVAKLGRIVLCSAILGDDPPAGLGSLLWKQISVLGSTGGTPVDFERVIQLIVGGALRPVVADCFPLRDAARAHTAFEQHDHVGKLVLLPGA